MADSTLPLIEALQSALQTDATLSPYLGTRVYTQVLPEKATFPCALIDAHGAPFDTITTQGMSHDVRLVLFSKTYGAKEALTMRSLVHDALHHGTLAIEGFTFLSMRVDGPNSTQLMPDRATWRSTIRLNIKVTK